MRARQFNARRLCWMVAFATLLLVRPARAIADEERPIPTPNKINADRLRWLDYTMVAGRIAITSDNVGTNMTYGPAQSDPHRRERLEIQIHPARVQLRYQLKLADEGLSIELTSGNKAPSELAAHRFTLSHRRPGYSLTFEQQPHQPLRLELVAGQTQQAWQATSFWHLYVMQPDVVSSRLAPLLEVLHPSWQLTAAARQMEDLLLARGQEADLLETQRWQRLVDALGSPRFTDRVSAQRELRATGQVIVPYLQNLDRRRLDAEQTSRVRALLEALSPGYQDSPERLTVWLAGDAQIWLSLLERPAVAVRQIATQRLSTLLGKPLDFDPTADPSKRATQLVKLRERLAPALVPPPAAER